jgi:hypothetical protein
MDAESLQDLTKKQFCKFIDDSISRLAAHPLSGIKTRADIVQLKNIRRKVRQTRPRLSHRRADRRQNTDSKDFYIMTISAENFYQSISAEQA